MTNLTRRDLLERGAGAAVLAATAAPTLQAAAEKFDGTLRIASLGFDIGFVPSVAARAEKDLGLRIVVEYADLFRSLPST